MLTILCTLLVMENLNCSIFLRNVGTISTFCWFMCYIPLTVNALNECQFVCCVLFLAHYFYLINGRLSSLTKTKTFQSESHSILFLLRKLHLELHWASCKLSKAFSFQILTTLTSSFLRFATHTYFCFNGLIEFSKYEKKLEVYELFTSILWTLSKLGQIFALCWACEITSKEVPNGV